MAKKKSWLRIVLVFGLCLGIFNWSKADKDRELEEKLREVHQSYLQKDYSRSKEILTQLAESFPHDPHFSYFEFMTAKCEYHLENYRAAQQLFVDFIKKYPQSRFVPACYFMLGNTNYRWHSRFESAQSFVLAYQKAEDDELRELAAKSIEPLLKDRLSERELDRLAQRHKNKELAPRIFFWLGKRAFESKDYRKAQEALTYYQDNFPKGVDTKEVSLLLERLSSPASQVLKVGVLTPLTGDYSNYGESMLKGIDLALQHSFLHPEVEIVLKDTKGDPIAATSLSKELIEEQNVIAIIGPLKSESTLGAGMVADGARIPLISPTASQKGIGNLGDFIFQITLSSQTRAKSLAEFLVKERKLLDFVLLVSDDQHSQEFGLSFQEELQKSGAKIIAIQHLYKEATDLANAVRTVKKILLEIPPSGYLSEEEESFINQIPVKVDGFFVVAGKDQMLKILPQISFSKINTTVIGTDACGNTEVLNLAQNLSQELIFTSDTYHLEDDQAWMSFVALYRNKYGEEPDRVAALGFDSMNLLINLFEKGMFTPEEIKENLVRMRNFEGASGAIRFDQYGENKSISIFACQGGKVVELR